ncbi:YetF domain-containing protein [Kosakonia sp. BYX6]|uniref:YetF domain-containing protein n=1 Tax=Kosakonia calanthes TaxID=3139408 RepID=A0ABZ3B232_9ENTR
MDMVLRAVAIYLVLMVVFKIAGRRTLLQMTSFDLILLLIISEATQQALLGNDFSVTGAALTIITLVVIDILFGTLKKYVKGAENLIDGTPVVLVENGEMVAENMREADISRADIMLSARNNQGIVDLAEIKFAILERNGHISIIPKNSP